MTASGWLIEIYRTVYILIAHSSNIRLLHSIWSGYRLWIPVPAKKRPGRVDSGSARGCAGKLTDRAVRCWTAAVVFPGRGRQKLRGAAVSIFRNRSTVGKTTNQLGPVRDTLIRKGMIYSPAHGDIAFTVPLFDQFMKRTMSMPATTKRARRRGLHGVGDDE